MMPKPRTTLIQFTEPYVCLGQRFNRGDVVRLPRRMAQALLANKRALIAPDGSTETGSTVADLHESSRRGMRPKASRPTRETKADGVPETKGGQDASSIAQDASDGVAGTSAAERDPDGWTTTQDVIDGLGDMTVIQLRERCRDAGLDDSGLKSRLVARLAGHLRREAMTDGEG